MQLENGPFMTYDDFFIITIFLNINVLQNYLAL